MNTEAQFHGDCDMTIENTAIPSHVNKLSGDTNETNF